jgi:unsaturated rhamnogalacturonyl hydrolase
MTSSPLEFAVAACETIIRKYDAADLPSKGTFGYTQGVFLSGVWKTALLTNDERYFRYVKDWMDSVISPDGEIIDYYHLDFDTMQPGILLFNLLDKYGDQKYRKALDNIIEQLKSVPVGPTGGYWHKMRRNSQMWLDGLYMIGPLMSEYAQRFNRPDLANQVVFQAKLMFEMTRNPATGLLLHAWDGRKVQPWADPETGQSPEHWGRSIGWVPIALLDDADHFELGSHEHGELISLTLELLRAVVRYQSAQGRWFQVVDKGDRLDNWLENSASSLFAAALAKAVRLGFVTGDEATAWTSAATRAFQGVTETLYWENDQLQVGEVCIGTGVGDYQFYIDRPTEVNDLHGVGAFLLMCTELATLEANKDKG